MTTMRAKVYVLGAPQGWGVGAFNAPTIDYEGVRALPAHRSDSHLLSLPSQIKGWVVE